MRAPITDAWDGDHFRLIRRWPGREPLALTLTASGDDGDLARLIWDGLEGEPVECDSVGTQETSHVRNARTGPPASPAELLHRFNIHSDAQRQLVHSGS